MYTTLHRVARFDLALGVHVMGRRARAGVGGGLTGDTLGRRECINKLLNCVNTISQSCSTILLRYMFNCLYTVVARVFCGECFVVVLHTDFVCVSLSPCWPYSY